MQQIEIVSFEVLTRSGTKYRVDRVLEHWHVFRAASLPDSDYKFELVGVELNEPTLPYHNERWHIAGWVTSPVVKVLVNGFQPMGVEF